MPAESSEDFKSKYQLYRKLTIFLTVACVFLLVVVIGQFGMKSNEDSLAGMQSPETPGRTSEASTVVSMTDSVSPTSSGSAVDETVQSSEHAPRNELPFVRRDPADPMAIGDVNAPVVLVEWTDFRCPFCAAFTRDTMPTIMAEYVDAGLVRIEVHDVAFFGDESLSAAVAARAAGKQGKYFEYLSTIYDAAPAKGHPDMPRKKLIAFAKTAGVPDIAKFTAHLDDPEVIAEVQASMSQAQQLGVTSVPFFVAGNQSLAGAQPLDVFRRYLDDAVAAAQNNK